MSRQTITRAPCPACQRDIALRPDSGTFRTHGPVGDRCRGSWHRPAEVSGQSEIAAALRQCWRIGDALGAACLTGIELPPLDLPAGLDPDEALIHLTDAARVVVADMARRVGVALAAG